MITWLASYPRSGNTYFRILLHHFYGIRTTSLYSETMLSTAFESSGFYPLSKPLEEISAGKTLFWIKSHELPSDDFPAIYLVRDGRDALLSYTWYILTIEKARSEISPALFWQTLHDLITDNRYFGGWSSHVLEWSRRQAPTAIVKFEDLIREPHPLHLIQQACCTVGYHFTEKIDTPSLPSFSELRRKVPDFFRQGHIGAWKTQIPPKLHDLFWEYHGNAMNTLGYSRGIPEYAELPIEQQAHLLPCYDEELTITETIIRSQKQELFDKEQVIREISALSEQRLQKVQTQQNELVAKEEIIQILLIFQRSSLRYWCVHRPKIFLKRILPITTQERIRRIRRIFQPKLGQFYQYQPIPVKISKQHRELLTHTRYPSSVISIVTPSFNHAQFLEHTLKSVLSQDYPNLEYIVQDGGSTDGSVQILEKYQNQLTYVESCQDKGQAHAINLGFRHASGEIMAWLNSDDILLPGTLPYIAAFFHEYPEVDVVYGHRIIIDEQDQEIGRWVLPPHDHTMLLWADYVPQETLFWRRRIWEKTGGYVDESYHFALDWEMLLRFYDAGAKFARLPRFLAGFRVHDAQKTSRELEGRGWQEMSKLRKQRHGRDISNQEALHQLRHYMRKHLLYHACYRTGLLQY